MNDTFKRLEELWPSDYRSHREYGQETDSLLASDSQVLPLDYLRLLNTFGHGTLCIDGELIIEIFDLTSGQPSKRAVELLDSIRYYAEQFNDSPTGFPENGGLLPWAENDQGGTYFWTTASSAAEWDVLFGESTCLRNSELKTIGSSVVEAIVSMFERQIEFVNEVSPGFWHVEGS